MRAAASAACAGSRSAHDELAFAGSHHIRWDARSAGGKRAEAWLRLGAEHWYLDGPRPPKEKPNPHFAALPPKAGLVGMRIKHYWPKMGRQASLRTSSIMTASHASMT